MQQLIEKWNRTGLLRYVDNKNVLTVVERLEKAFERSMKAKLDFVAMEVTILREQGYFKLPKNH